MATCWWGRKTKLVLFSRLKSFIYESFLIFRCRKLDIKFYFRQKFEIGQKILKNNGLTLYFFCEIFDIKNSLKFEPKMTQIRQELSYLG